MDLCRYQDQVQTPQMSGSGSTLDQIMYSHINFHKLAFTQDNSHVMFPWWITKKKTVINPTRNYEQCLKGAVVAVLFIADIKHHLDRISLS